MATRDRLGSQMGLFSLFMKMLKYKSLILSAKQANKAALLLNKMHAED